MIPKKLQEYPNPRSKKVALATNTQLIKDTQTMMESPPPTIIWGPISQKPSLETILKASPSAELDSVKD